MFDSQPGFNEPLLVTTLVGGQNGLCFPLAPVYEAVQLKHVRLNLHLQALSCAANGLVVEIRVQRSNDRGVWDPSTTTRLALPTSVSLSAEGITDNATWDDATTLATKRYLRFVLWVKNGAGITALGTALAALRLERKSC